MIWNYPNYIQLLRILGTPVQLEVDLYALCVEVLDSIQRMSPVTL